MELYFAVGSDDEPYSSTWKVWTHRGQVYAAPRISGGFFKISLHTPDAWLIAFTSESGVVVPETGTRTVGTWRRPPEFAPGWTRGPTIVVPRTHESSSFPPIQHGRRANDVLWLRPPQLGEQLLIVFLFQSAATPQPLGPDDQMIGDLRLDTGETLWLATRWTGMTTEEERLYRPMRDLLRIQGGNPAGALMLQFGDTAEGVPYIVEVPLGLDNVDG
jgi:hypothetical protein